MRAGKPRLMWVNNGFSLTQGFLNIVTGRSFQMTIPLKDHSPLIHLLIPTLNHMRTVMYDVCLVTLLRVQTTGLVFYRF